MEFHGNITALVTPFVGGAFDQEGFRENIRRQLRAGVDGLLALGTTGEGSALSTDERLEVSRLLIDEAKGKTALLVQTGDLSTKQTIEKTAGAEKLGFDGVVVITPYYNRPPQEGLLSHFRSIARSTTLPILLYNNPVRTGVHLELSTLLALAEEENIVGIKDCSGDILYAAQILKKIPHWRFFSGDDKMVLAHLSMGAHGIISTLSNLLPTKMKTLVQTKEKEAYFSLLPFIELLSLETNPMVIKGLMDAWGFAAGKCRLPLTPLPEKICQKIEGLRERATYEV